MTAGPKTDGPGTDPPDKEDDGGQPAGDQPIDSKSARAVDRLIGKFGGIRPMAHKLTVPVTTVQGWKKRGAIPTARHPDLRAAATRLKIPLTAAELEAAAPVEERARAAQAEARPSAEPTAEPTSSTTTPHPAAAANLTPPEKAGETMSEKKTPGSAGEPKPSTPTTPLTPTPPASKAKTESVPPTPPKPEPAKGETARPEPAKPEPAKGETAKPEPAKGETAKPEPIKSEPAKPETVRPEPAAKPDLGKTETAKVEPAKVEPAKVEPAKVEPAKSAAPAPAVAARPQRGGSGAAWLAALIALIGAGVAVTAPAWAPQVVGPYLGVTPPEQRIADAERRLSGRVQALEQAVKQVPVPPPAQTVDLGPLASRLQGLEQTVNTLRSQPAPQATADLGPLANRVQSLESTVENLSQRLAAVSTGGTPADIGPLVEQLQGLSRRLVQVEQRAQQPGIDAGALSQALAPLAARLAQVEGAAQAAQQNTQAVATLENQVRTLSQELSASAARVNEVAQALTQKQQAETAAQALVLASSQLKSALASSAPFQNELRAVLTLGARDGELAQALEQIAPRAATGIPSEARLIDGFEAIAGGIVNAARTNADGDWGQEALGRLQGLVTIRRQGPNTEGGDAGAVVARAEARLKQGDLAAAVQEVSTLSGPAAEVAAPWLNDARARLAAQHAGDLLARQAVALLTNAAGGGVRP